ncbi:hypothetical protein [Desulfogranum marinum]|uniref:hypothetical protein n=1 Tax=Desulfogranum marinum TaxID=453220 RepID=UPI00196673D4|nr:hypothetical protein [Desulfogranum marinum]MBM9511841.1 hypothetical protein [Desulfogranum marinum]
MQQLFILKSGTEYFRFTDTEYTRCSLQKASVYPMDCLDKVKQLHQQLQDDGISEAAIFILTLTEQPFTEQAGRE